MDREQYCGQFSMEWDILYSCGTSFRDYLGDDHDRSKTIMINQGLYPKEHPENEFSNGFGISRRVWQSPRTTYVYTH